MASLCHYCWRLAFVSVEKLGVNFSSQVSRDISSPATEFDADLIELLNTIFLQAYMAC